MIQMRFVPIERWPSNPARLRRPSPFDSPYLKTLDLLETELRHLRAKDIVLQVFMQWGDIRNDGWPRADARPTQPGVILTFASKDGPLSFPCDTYFDWPSNLRAIALSLQALRAVDRYGVTRRSEQYQGWRQIAAPGATPKFANAEDAAAFVCMQAYGDARNVNEILQDHEAYKKAKRSASARLHPDVGGSPEVWHVFQEATAIIEAAREL